MAQAPPKTGELKQALLAFHSAYVTIGAFSFIINLLMLAPSIYMLQVYDRALGSRNMTTLAALTAMVLGMVALMALLEWVRSMVLVRVFSPTLQCQIDVQWPLRHDAQLPDWLQGEVLVELPAAALQPLAAPDTLRRAA